MTMTSGTVDVHLVSPQTVGGVRPYALVGTGGYHVDNVPGRRGGICALVAGVPCSDEEVTVDAGLRLGLRLGGGLTLRATSRVQVFGDVRYEHVNPAPEVGDGGRFSSLSAHTGVLVSW
jgi:opacity protein-like surface antigen